MHITTFEGTNFLAKKHYISYLNIKTLAKFAERIENDEDGSLPLYKDIVFKTIISIINNHKIIVIIIIISLDWGLENFA